MPNNVRMKKKEHHEYLKQVCLIVGGQNKLAQLLDVSTPTVNQWLFMHRKIPAKRCPQIEKIVSGKIICEQLREDIDWAYLRQTKHAINE